jgi:malonate decarboxylase beta subunit
MDWKPVALSAAPLDQSWYEASARARLAGLLDADTFQEFIGPEQRMMSPHLPLFDLPRAFDDGMIVGRGRLDGRDELVGLLRAALHLKPAAVLILFDTGGVRLQEANAGETAIAEIMRAITQVRAAGIPVVGLIGGRAGCYGGGGLIAGTCARLVISEGGRLSVSGPEVIETNKGAEEFDSRDRALVWRTMGGKHRRLLGAADAFAADTIGAFRSAARAAITTAPAFDLATLEAEQARLEARLDRFGDARDATEIWGRLGVNDPDAVPGLTTEGFDALLDSLPECAHDAR